MSLPKETAEAVLREILRVNSLPKDVLIDKDGLLVTVEVDPHPHMRTVAVTQKWDDGETVIEVSEVYLTVEQVYELANIVRKRVGDDAFSGNGG